MCLGTALVQALENAVEAQLQQKTPGARFSVQTTPFSVHQVQNACGVAIDDMVI